mgnify:CR=1 FL=1
MGADAQGDRQRTDQGRQRRHHDGPETQHAGLADGQRRGHAVVALLLQREVDHHDRVLLHDADQHHDADGGDDGQLHAEELQRDQRAHRGGRQAGQDGQRVEDRKSTRLNSSH